MASPIIQRQKQRWLGSIVLAAILLIMGLFFQNQVIALVHWASRPFVVASVYIHTHTLGSFIGSGDALLRIKELEAQRHDLVQKQLDQELLLLENTQLRAQLGFLEKRPYETIGVHIVSRSFSSIESLFVIDAGSAQGIQEGDPVIVSSGVLAGIVTNAKEHFSTVRTLTDRQSLVSVSILNQQRVIGIAKGQSGVLLKLELIPQDVNLTINDLVVTSGLDQGIPSGLIIGLINDVISDPAEPFQQAFVEPEFDVSHQSLVSVILQPDL